jgi:DNA repair protein RecO (recombination protein O)
MSRYQIDAFVIRSSRMTESSRLLTLFSRELGKVKGVAKGSERPKSRLGGKIELFNLIECDFYKKETVELGTLSNAGLLEDFKRIAEEPRKFGFASAWCEVLDKSSHTEEPHPETFDLTFEYLKTLEAAESQAAGLLFWSAIMKFLGLEGYAPSLEACVSCGEIAKAERLMVSLERGGLVCGNCVGPEEPVVVISPDALELLRLMDSAPLTEIASREIEPRIGKTAAEVILSLANYHLGLPRSLKSFKFLEGLR